jgi:class 3 adenylate cyclase
MSEREYSRFFDPYIYERLNDLMIAEVNNTYLTIVFWDISNFSDLCKELQNNETLIQFLLKEYYDSASSIIKKNRGIIDKFIGDGIMAIFGYLDKKDIEGVDNAIIAALQLRKNYNIIKKEFIQTCSNFYSSNVRTDFNLKCGIHSGNVLFGYWKSKYRSQITAIGNEVNIASRLVNIKNYLTGNIKENFKDDEIIISKQSKNNYGFLKDNKKKLKGTVVTFEELYVKNTIKSHKDIDKVFLIKEL